MPPHRNHKIKPTLSRLPECCLLSPAFLHLAPTDIFYNPFQVYCPVSSRLLLFSRWELRYMPALQEWCDHALSLEDFSILWCLLFSCCSVCFPLIVEFTGNIQCQRCLINMMNCMIAIIASSKHSVRTSAEDRLIDNRLSRYILLALSVTNAIKSAANRGCLLVWHYQ